MPFTGFRLAGQRNSKAIYIQAMAADQTSFALVVAPENSSAAVITALRDCAPGQSLEITGIMEQRRSPSETVDSTVATLVFQEVMC